MTPAAAGAQQAPRVLGTAQSEEEFQGYRAVMAAVAPADVVAQAEAYLRRYPGSGLGPYVRQSAVVAYDRLGDLDNVIKHGEALLEDLPENVPVLVALARAYAETGAAARCIERATAARDLLGRMREPATDAAAWRTEVRRLEGIVHLSLGTAYLRQAHADGAAAHGGEALARALASLEAALRIDPASSLGSYRLAQACLLKGDRDRAVRYYAYTVALDGSVAAAARAKLRQLLGGSEADVERAVRKARDEARRRAEPRRPPAGSPAP